TVFPGAKGFTSAPSQAPVPDAGKMIPGWLVLKTGLASEGTAGPSTRTQVHGGRSWAEPWRVAHGRARSSAPGFAGSVVRWRRSSVVPTVMSPARLQRPWPTAVLSLTGRVVGLD